MDSFPKIKDWNKWEQDNIDNKLQLIEKKKNEDLASGKNSYLLQGSVQKVVCVSCFYNFHR